MSSIPWIMIIVVILLVVLGIIAIAATIQKKKKGKKRVSDYYAFFIMGITWVPLGIVMYIMDKDSSLGNIFFILGLIYLVIGLANRDKWKENRQPYLIQNKFWRWAVIIGLLVLFALGIIVYALVKR